MPADPLSHQHWQNGYGDVGYGGVQAPLLIRSLRQNKIAPKLLRARQVDDVEVQSRVVAGIESDERRRTGNARLKTARGRHAKCRMCYRRLHGRFPPRFPVEKVGG